MNSLLCHTLVLRDTYDRCGVQIPEVCSDDRTDMYVDFCLGHVFDDSILSNFYHLFVGECVCLRCYLYTIYTRALLIISNLAPASSSHSVAVRLDDTSSTVYYRISGCALHETYYCLYDTIFCNLRFVTF